MVATIYLCIGVAFLVFGKRLLKIFISLISGFVTASYLYNKIGIDELPGFVYVLIFFVVAFVVSLLSNNIHAIVLGVFLGLQLGAFVYSLLFSNSKFPYIDMICLAFGAVICAWFCYYNAETSMIFTSALFGTNLIATSIALFTGYMFGVYNLII